MLEVAVSVLNNAVIDKTHILHIMTEYWGHLKEKLLLSYIYTFTILGLFLWPHEFIYF